MKSTEQKKQELYRPEITIDTNLVKAFDMTQIDGYSMTPTTFKSRHFDSKKYFYIDNYSYGKNSVLRYGIDTQKISVQDIINEGFHVDTQKGASTLKTKNINQNTTSHLQIELIVLQEAVNCLLDQGCNVVLVDILERTKGVIIEENSILKIHTVALYKNLVNQNGTHTICVIDPSNFLFSSHLASTNVDIGKIVHTKLDKIETLHKNLQIYKSAGGTGTQNNEYRDCIDIATKIAFGLADTDNINLNDIKNLDVVVKLSNQRLDSNIINPNSISRIKQTSDIKTVSKFFEASNVLNSNIRLLEIKQKGTAEENTKKYTEIVNQVTLNTNILEELLVYNSGLTNQLSDIFKTEQTQLSGMPSCFEGGKTGD